MTLIKKKQQHCIDPQDGASYEAIHKSRRGSCSSGGRVIEGCWIDPVILLPPTRQSVLDKDGGGGGNSKRGCVFTSIGRPLNVSVKWQTVRLRGKKVKSHLSADE